MPKHIFQQVQYLLLFVLVVVLLKIIDFGLRHTSYKRVCIWLLHLSPQPDSQHVDIKRAISIARLINRVASRPFMQATCLRRSLTLWWLLRWRGIPSHVQIAFGAKGGHAWVEHAGAVINDDPSVRMNYTIQFAGDLFPEKMADLV